jgi:hypothetical protein
MQKHALVWIVSAALILGLALTGCPNDSGDGSTSDSTTTDDTGSTEETGGNDTGENNGGDNALQTTIVAVRNQTASRINRVAIKKTNGEIPVDESGLNLGYNDMVSFTIQEPLTRVKVFVFGSNYYSDDKTVDIPAAVGYRLVIFQ